MSMDSITEDSHYLCESIPLQIFAEGHIRVFRPQPYSGNIVLKI